MRQFRYSAARPDGEVMRGALTAAHRQAAIDTLAQRHLLPLEIEEQAIQENGRRLPRAELAVFLRGLATLVRAGVPLDAALAASDTSNTLAGMVAETRRHLREGRSLSAAFAAQGVPGVAVSLVRAGEKAGLAGALEHAAAHVEREAELRNRVRAALAYPAVLLVVGVSAVGVLITTVLPRFVALLGDQGNALPAMTRLLLASSTFIREHGIALAVVLVVLAVATARGLATEAGHQILLRVPVLGLLRMHLATTRVARALSALLDVGAPALAALGAAELAAGDKAVSRRIRLAVERVRSGATISAALGAERALTPQAIQLLAVGERSSRAGDLLRHAADLSEAHATRAIDSAVRLIEPLLIVCFGLVVTVVALALLQAVYGLRVR